MCTDECKCPRGQRYEILLEWEFQAGVSCLMWVLLIELRSSGREVCTLNH